MVVVKKTNTSWYIAGLHFQCQQCGSCCSGPDEGVIWISRPEINMLAEHLGLSVSEIRKKYLRRIGFRFSIRENPCSKDCVFLANINPTPIVPDSSQKKIDTTAGERNDFDFATTRNNRCGVNGFKGCTIYNARPMQCRNWPFWPGNLQSPDDWNAAAIKCPGINPAPIVPGSNQEKNDSSRTNGLLNKTMVRDSTGVERSGFDFAATRNNRCGVNKGRLYSFDEIQKIKKLKQWRNNSTSCLAVAGTATSLICDEVVKIYDWLDSTIKPLNNKCDACGKCCYFDSFGHKLFITTPELLYFYENVKPLRKMTGSCCPYLENGTPPHQFILQKANLKEHLKLIGSAFKTPHQGANWCGGKCSARNFRFAGCRIFFCKSDKDLQNNLSEEAANKFKSLCDKFDFPYRYVDLMTALNMK